MTHPIPSTRTASTKPDIETGIRADEIPLQETELAQATQRTQVTQIAPITEEDLTENTDLKGAGELLKSLLWMTAGGAIAGISMAQILDPQNMSEAGEIGSIVGVSLASLIELCSPSSTSAKLACMIKYPCQTLEIAVGSWDGFVKSERARRQDLGLPTPPPPPPPQPG